MKAVIVHRAIEKFCRVFLTERFNLSLQKLFVRFAGGAASDAGESYQEFLTFSMKHFSGVKKSFFGGPFQLCFTSNTELILSNTYYKLGQLCASAIVNTGRGPEALHSAITRAIYDIDQPEHIEAVEDAEFEDKLGKINKGELTFC